MTRWRWLCVECWTEGRDERPDACPGCGCTYAWYETNTAGSDPRPMRQVFEDFSSRLFGSPRTKLN